MDMFTVKSLIIKTLMLFFKDKSFYAGSSDTIYKLDDANLRIPILNPTTDIHFFARRIC